jgi:hypothetical protein
MNFFYKLPVDNLKEIQMSALRKITLDDINKVHTRLFYPKYNFLDDLNLVSVLKSHNLYEYIYDIALFVMGPNHISPIHIDGDTIYTWSFNIPLSGCANTKTNFFISDYTPIKTKSSNSDIVYSTYNVNQCQLVDSLELNEPYIMNVSKPHNIINLNHTPRISLCIRIKSDFGICNLIKILDNNHGSS